MKIDHYEGLSIINVQVTFMIGSLVYFKPYN